MPRLVLLPGLDGTGALFAPLLEALSPSVATQVVSYPIDRALDYDALLPLVRAALPEEPFVLVGESFSGPLAIRLAAARPAQLRALVLVASFHRRPVGPALAMLRPFVRDAVFRAPPPAFVVRRMLAGADAPASLVTSFREASRSVDANVLATRVRAALDADVTAELTQVRVPITYFAAAADALVRREIPDEMRALVPTLEVRTFASPHLVLQRCPREAAAALEAVLARCT